MNNDSEMDLLSLLDDYFILQSDPLLNDQNNESLDFLKGSMQEQGLRLFWNSYQGRDHAYSAKAGLRLLV